MARFDLISDFTIASIIENPTKFDGPIVAMALEIREYRRIFHPLGCAWLDDEQPSDKPAIPDSERMDWMSLFVYDPSAPHPYSLVVGATPADVRARHENYIRWLNSHSSEK